MNEPKAKAAAPAAPPEDEGVTESAALDASWVFIDRDPTVAEVEALLAGLEVPLSGGSTPSLDGMTHGPTVEPLTMDRYLPYVLPMSNRMRVKVPDPSREGREIDDYVTQRTLYTQVAGRLAMLNDVAARRGLTVDVYPETNVPTGLPGYLVFGDLLLFRVYVEISANGRSLGRKFGTAGGKATGGQSAEGSNPHETVETSALGRALAQWGFGILPGSGIASVEEMRLAKQNLAAGTRGARPVTEKPKEERGDLIASAVDYLERRRKMAGLTEEGVASGMATWVNDKFSIDGFVGDNGSYGWGLLTDAQIALLRNSMRDAVQAAIAAGE